MLYLVKFERNGVTEWVLAHGDEDEVFARVKATFGINAVSMFYGHGMREELDRQFDGLALLTSI